MEGLMRLSSLQRKFSEVLFLPYSRNKSERNWSFVIVFVSSVRQLLMSLSNNLIGVESLKLSRYAILELFFMISSNDFSKNKCC